MHEIGYCIRVSQCSTVSYFININMGTVSIFVLLCEVVYLVNLCSSAVIDFQKERDDLCTMAGIVNRSCTKSEDVLLREAVKRNQELENERYKLENERDKRKEAEEKRDEYFNRTVRAEVQKDNYEGKYNDCSWLMCVRQVIDVYEDEYLKGELMRECGHHNSTAKTPIFKLDGAAVKKFTDYYDQQAEKRRQRWVFYGYHPPTRIFAALIQQVKDANMTIEDFANGIAQLFKTLSLLCHQGFFKGSKKPLTVHLHMFKDVHRAVNILLANVDFVSAMFVYDNTTSCQPHTCELRAENSLNSTIRDTQVH